MKTYNGQLRFGKREEEAMRIVLRHAKVDLSYGWDGSYGGHDKNNKSESKKAEQEIKKAEEGVSHIEWILDTFKKGGKMNY